MKTCMSTKVVSAATTNATSVRGAVTALVGYEVANTSAAVKYLKLYDKASAPTVGTDVPKMTIQLPAGIGVRLSFHVAILFANGLALAITGAAGDTDTTAVAAGDVIATVVYGLI